MKASDNGHCEPRRERILFQDTKYIRQSEQKGGEFPFSPNKESVSEELVTISPLSFFLSFLSSFAFLSFFESS